MKRRRLSRQAWIDLLWAAIGFIVVQLSVALAIEFRLAAVRDPEFTAKLERLRARRAETPDVPLVVALGSSRTKLGLLADDLGKQDGKRRALVFNLGLSGGGPMLQQLALRRLLAEGVKPDYLFVEVIPTSLLEEEDDRPVEERWLDASRLRRAELSWMRSYASDVPRLCLRWTASRLLPCQIEAAELHKALGVDGQPASFMSGCGWEPVVLCVTDEARQRYTALVRSQYEHLLRHFRLAPESLRALDDLLGMCRREEIPFTVVVMPEGQSFRALYPPAGEAEFQALLTRLQITWQVPVIDARSWVNEADFWDSHHLLPSGAKVFTERFDREVLTPLLCNGFKTGTGLLPPRVLSQF